MVTNKKINQFISLTKKHFRTYLGIAISVLLFIQFFHPFPVEKFDFENNLVFIAGFGLIILFCLLLSQIIFQSQLIRYENESSQDTIYVSLYFFTLVISTSLAFIFYIRFVGQYIITFNIAVRVIIIGISLPVVINLKNKINSYRSRIKKLTDESGSMREKIKNFSESFANKSIELISVNDSDNLRIQVSEIVYAKSADNYVEIGYQDNKEVKKKMIRNTLRNIELQLGEFNNFIRTHRTSIVNMQHIEKLNKNFNTYWISLYNTKETVPVSRQYLMAVKDLL